MVLHRSSLLVLMCFESMRGDAQELQTAQSTTSTAADIASDAGIDALEAQISITIGQYLKGAG